MLEMLEAETRPARRVDLDDAADAECIRIDAGRFWLDWHGRGDGGNRGDARDRTRDRDVIPGGELGRISRQWLGRLGGDGLRRGRVGPRRRGPEPHSGDDNRRDNTGQHQAQRITHRYSFQKRN